MTASLELGAIASAPAFSPGYVYRQHIVEAATKLAVAHGALLIQGDEGIGISSFLNEIVRNSGLPCLNLQIKTASRITYTVPYLIAQLMPQVARILGEPLAEFGNAIGDWRKAVLRLQQYVRRNGRALLFVVDGLNQVSPRDAKYVDDIIADLMCLGVHEISHVISIGRNVELRQRLGNSATNKDFELMPLSREESRSVLIANGLNEEIVEEILTAARGNPGVIAAACRLVKDGAKSLAPSDAGLTQFLRQEWDRFKSGLGEIDARLAPQIYANLLFSRQAFEQKALAARVPGSENLIEKIVTQQKFVRVSDDGVIEIAGSTARRLLETELSPLKGTIIQENIALLMQTPTSRAALELLPTFYDEAGEKDELLAYLTPETLDLWFGETGSLNLLQRRTLLGLEAASSAKLLPEIFRFSLETSAVRTLKQGINETKSKIALLGEMGNFEKALELTQDGPTSESRTILVAEYVRVAHRKKQPIEPLARERIAAAVVGLDEKVDQQLALDLATAIVGAFPDLAIAAVEKALNGRPKQRDAALGRLAVETLESNTSLHRTYAERITDSKLQAFVMTLGEMLGGKTLQSVRQIAGDLPTGQKFFFLKNWLKNSAENADAVEVAAFALNEIEREAGYTPTAADFCDLVEPAARNPSHGEAKRLLNRIESQIGLVKAHSSSVDLVRLQLYIAAGMYTTESLENVENRLLDAFYAIQDIGDVGTRLEATAWALTILNQFIVPTALDVKHKFKAVLSTDLLREAETVLANTAEHFEVSRGALRALCKGQPELAIGLVTGFNTQARRDEGFAEIAHITARSCESESYVEIALQAISRISGLAQRRDAIKDVMRAVSQRPALNEAQFSLLTTAADSISDPGHRADAYIRLCSNAFSRTHHRELAAAFSKFLEFVKEADDLTMLRSRIFWMLQVIAAVDRTLALDAYSDAEAILSAVRESPRALAVTNYYCARLAVTSFAGIAARRLDTEQHLLRLLQHIETIPVFRWRMMLLNDLAIGVHFSGRRDIRDRVCADHIIRKLSVVDDGFAEQYFSIAGEALPSLYLWNQAVARDLLRKFSSFEREDTIEEIAATLLRGTGLLNPHDDPTLSHRQLTYEEAQMVADLLEQLTVDSMFVNTVEMFLSALNNRLNRGSFTVQQRQGFVTRLRAHADKILPDPRNIKHQGWRILFDIKLAKMQDAKAFEWKDFEKEIDSVPNLSDQVLLFGELAAAMPGRFEIERKALCKKAEVCLGKVPSIVDRALRAVSLSKAAGGNDKELAEKLLREALDYSLTTDSDEAVRIRKMVVDAAYRLDERMAERLVERIDDDPARARAKRQMKAECAMHRASKAIGRGDVKSLEKLSNLGESSRKALGSLYASRSNPLDAAKSITVVSKAASGTLEENWAAFSWFLKASALRADKHPQKFESLLTSVHEMIQLSAELTSRLSDRLCGDARSQPTVASMNEYVIGDHGSRAEVLNTIVGWLTESVVDEVLLCDPYFKAAAMELVWMIHAVKPDVSYCVLTHLRSNADAEKLRSELLAQWRALTDEPCPPMALIGCHFEDKIDQCPIHDRWVLGAETGAQLGTSVGDIGQGRLSAADRLDSIRVTAIRQKLNRYLQRGKRHTDGRALRYVLASV